jgi:hypothetical protein
VDYVDEIARRQKRDVLWFFFDPDHYEALDDGFVQRDIDRQIVIDYLAAKRAEWHPCYGIYSGWWHDGETAHLYLDLSYDKGSVIFQEIDRRFCVEVDGEEVPAIPGICFCILSYEVAQANEEAYSSGLDDDM